ncbi:acyltransferase family protein [Dyadobacter arcticus]|uniref:Peptidoglycan/LPS O-acetylase OafA/YrhL n=1 Tax=Dyadobacter arcticus TaxID=1078754 RepID=A0ABX0UKX1_9BACT|nr:acyltransferase [Dyadobacter arcticus]NIJ52070.1 peptidoglycan/LPS O-acetylase OafA/YrhL [Dyadobacter arcticus]
MRTTSEGHIIQLDGVRFIAVGLVLVDHLFVTVNNIPYGALGVTIFFVLSGFLISRILLKSKEKTQGTPGGFKKYLRKFLIRRTIRIFPVYYLIIALLLVFDVPPVREKLAWLALYGTNIYMAIHKTWMGSVDHLWSLAVEEQVYLVFPFLIFFIPKDRLIPVLGVMGVLSLAFRFFYFFSMKDFGAEDWIVTYVSTPACLDSFALGGLMAWLQLYKGDLFTKLFNKSWPVVLALLAWILIQFWAKSVDQKYNIAFVVFDRTIASILGFFLIGRAVIGFHGLMAYFLENPVSIYLGKISYGLYLYHNFVYNHFHSGPMHLTVRLFRKIYQYIPELRGSVAFEALIVAALTILVASLSWLFFEKPINALKDKYAY